jgi:hypothetical protein
MLYESQVTDGVCSFLEVNGFSITQRLSAIEHGEDIIAIAPDGKTRVSIEAKGETSSRAGSRRYGKSFNSGQVWDHVSKAVYKAALHFSTGTLAAVALPRNPAHVECISKILPALKHLDIEIFGSALMAKSKLSSTGTYGGTGREGRIRTNRRY